MSLDSPTLAAPNAFPATDQQISPEEEEKQTHVKLRLFGSELLNARRAKHWNQTEVGQKVGCTKSYISALERATLHPITKHARKPEKYLIDRLAQLLSPTPEQAPQLRERWRELCGHTLPSQMPAVYYVPQGQAIESAGRSSQSQALLSEMVRAGLAGKASEREIQERIHMGQLLVGSQTQKMRVRHERIEREYEQDLIHDYVQYVVQTYGGKRSRRANAAHL